MEIDFITGFIFVFFEIIIILGQIYFIIIQISNARQLKKETHQWQSQIESLYSGEIKNIIEQNKKLLHIFSNYLDTKN